MNRRNFIQKTALSAVGLGLGPIISSSYSSIYGATAPSNKVKVALIGCRSMGFADLNTFLQYPEVECVALCDVDDEWLQKRAGDVEKKTGKKVPNLYKDWRKVITTKMWIWSSSVHPIIGIVSRQSRLARQERMFMSKSRFRIPSKNVI